MGQYLYGAAVQGIQGFIFQTDELKDIVGASELVENICTELFAKVLYGRNGSREELIGSLNKDDNAVLNAAGNIKYIFDTRADCEKMVREFPKRVLEYAPGITVSQAVVEMKVGGFREEVDKLEEKLRAQRNKPMSNMNIGLMGILRSRQTGLPAVWQNAEDYLDAGTMAKRYCEGKNGTMEQRSALPLCRKAFCKDKNEYLGYDNIAFDVTGLTDRNSWIAVIHADGNGLGQVVQKVGKNEKVFREFSRELDKATRLSAQQAYGHVSAIYEWGKVIPIRPVVLGGDDLTVLCRADLALDYVQSFIENFEDITSKGILSEIIKEHEVFTEGIVRDRLTACAGIAYIKDNYPFYYGYELAEALCTMAKKDAKKDIGGALPQSCVMFHKVQDSFVEGFDRIAERELRPWHDVSLEFGPYYIREKAERWTVEELKGAVDMLKDESGNVLKTRLRQWLTLIGENPEMAVQHKDRSLKMIGDKKEKSLFDMVTSKRNVRTVGEDKVYAYPAYDMLSLHTIKTQEIRKEEKK